MKILLVHNSYVEPGGEDQVVLREKETLARNGHEVIYYHRCNDEIEQYNLPKKWQFLRQEAIWSTQSYEDLKKLLQEHRPEIVHVHNTFYVISPSIYRACQEEGVPVVQSFHNYRPLLTGKNAHEFPEFNPGKDLKKKILRSFLVPRILKKCYQEKIYEEKIDRFVLLSNFSKDIFVRHGFDAHKFEVISPAVRGGKRTDRSPGAYGIFVGRLVDYKGIEVLLETIVQVPDVHMRIVGDGPLKERIVNMASTSKNVDYVGRLPHAELLEEMKKAAFLIFPSLCYETFGQVIIEAFACGLPVIASKNTAAEDLVEDGETGLFFEKGNAKDLAMKIRQLLQDPESVKTMGKNARLVYEQRYSQEKNYEKLINLYKKVIESKTS